jgi:hypothetical protein
MEIISTMFSCCIMTQGLPYGKSRCERCWRKPIMSLHWIVLEISELLFGLIRRKERILLRLWSMIWHWYDHRFIVFSLRWSLLDCDLSGDMMDASSDIMLLQLYEEHNSDIRKKNLWWRWLLCMLVANIILFALRVFVVMHVKILLCYSSSWWRLFEVQEGDCFLLDTTTFSTVSLSAIQLSMLFQEGLLQSWSSIAC